MLLTTPIVSNRIFADGLPSPFFEEHSPHACSPAIRPAHFSKSVVSVLGPAWLIRRLSDSPQRLRMGNDAAVPGAPSLKFCGTAARRRYFDTM
jgi:hypothetical protein